jgi:hypothetical protein
MVESVTGDMSLLWNENLHGRAGTNWFKLATRGPTQTAPPSFEPIMGAAIGSVVPGVGTAIGGAVGAWPEKMANNPRSAARSLRPALREPMSGAQG